MSTTSPDLAAQTAAYERLRKAVRRCLADKTFWVVHADDCPRRLKGTFHSLPEDCKCSVFPVQALVLEHEELE